MLEGLEIREFQLSECIKNKDYRIDTDYYIKSPLKNEDLTYKRIGDCLLYSQYGISIEMNEVNKGYPIYRMNEIHDMLCDIETNKYADIDKDTFEIFRLNDKDVLFNRTNSYDFVGRTGIYYNNDGVERTFASYLVKFVPNSEIILPEYLATYLNTKHGIGDIKRRARQSINQTNVNPEEVKEMDIPILSMDIQKAIQDRVVFANKLRCQADCLYKEAGNYLSETISDKKVLISEKNINIISYKRSFLDTGRWDAEYYQPQYEDYSKLVQSYQNSNEYIGSICNIKDTNYIPNSKRKYKYVELSNISKHGSIDSCTESEGYELPTRARRIVATGDVIVSSIEGSLDSCALVTEEYNEALCSTGFYVVRSSFFNPETLLVLFKSKPIQMLMKKGCSGTILTAISKNELEKIPLPLITEDVQKQIAQKVQQSFSLRSESKHLLELARQAVEIAIGEGEETALKFIKGNDNDKA